MLYERFARAEICPALPEGATEISLTAYARADIGALVGGASLDSTGFAALINAVHRVD